MFSGLPDVVLATLASQTVTTVARYLPYQPPPTPRHPPVMRLLPKQKHWKKLSVKTKKFVSKMIPVEDNIFRPIPWNRPSQSSRLQQDPRCNHGIESTERKNVYLNPFKRIAATLKIKKSGTNDTREHL